MTVPCGSIQYTSWALNSQVREVWEIHVHISLILNITILQAYVPYSDHCSPHAIEVHEGLAVSDHSFIDIFCGMIKYESIYTKQSKAAVVLQFKARVLPNKVVLMSTYTTTFSPLSMVWHINV